MDLYFIRHAIAEQLGRKNEFADEKRALTSDGRDRCREAAMGLRKLGVEFDLIMTSPLTRALETTDILASTFGVGKKHIKQTSNLAPGASAGDLFAEIKQEFGVESLALVGHQPELGELISKIIRAGGDASISLKKSGVCCVEVAETVPTLRGGLVWLLTPRQLRLLAK
jgi:phosphohistidine phosphatase